MATHRIAVIAGDGIGTEVMPEGVRVLEAVASRFGIGLELDHFDFACWPWYEKHGSMMPDDWKEQIGGHDAIFFGAVGWPAKMPDHVSLWGSLIKFRRDFDLYVNLRPARLMPGVRSPLAGLKPGDIDMMIVRENTEGEYSSVGGRMYPDTEREIVIQETVMSRIGVDRVLKFAFELAAVAAEEAPHLGDQVERHRHHHAVLGRAGRRDGGALSRRQGRSLPHRHPDRPLRATAAVLRHRRRQQPVRRHPERPGAGLHRDDRHCPLGQHQSLARASFAVRAGARLGARTSPAAASPIRSARSGRARRCSTSWAIATPTTRSSRRSRRCWIRAAAGRAPRISGETRRTADLGRAIAEAVRRA